jgi:UDPglucose 6-dehydrogenase
LTEARRLFGDRVRYATDALNCIDQADCCILVTEWPEFRNLRPRIFKEKMRQPVLIDGRKLYDPAEFRMEGIQFHAIGLGPET